MVLSKLLHGRRHTNRRNHRSDTPAQGRTSRKLRMEPLEGRVLLDAAPVFDSVLGIGDAAATIITAWDNAVDAAGNTYVTGNFTKAVDFDPNTVRSDGSDILTPRGSGDAFVAKYAPDNSLIWARRMGGDFIGILPYESAGSMAVDSAGNVYITGQFVNQADFGSFTLTSAGSADAFVAKLSSNGNFLWGNRWGTSSTMDSGQGIAVDAGGNVLAVGSTAIVFSDGSFTHNGVEMRKYSPTGATVWTKQISTLNGWPEGVATDTAGNMYVNGVFRRTVDFNPDPKKTYNVTGSSTASNEYVLKLTADGKFAWVAPFIAKSASSFVEAGDIAVDGASNIVVGGYFRGPVDFDPNLSVDYRLPDLSTVDVTGFVAKLSPSGSLSWATPVWVGSVNSIAVDAGGVYAAGKFVSHLTTSGVVDWAVTPGGTGWATARGIAVDQEGTIHVAGYYHGTVDFDPDPLSTYELTGAGSPMFLLKLRKQSAAALNDAALASLTLADTQRSTPSGKKASVFDSEMDWLAVAQV